MSAGISKERAFLELCRRNFRAYCLFVHERRWIPGRAVSFVCDSVQEFLSKKTGNAYDILVLSMPPQHGKSMTVTETLPSWYLVNHPDRRVIGISYSEDFAQMFGRRNRRKLMDFGKYWDVYLASSPNSNTEFEIKNHAGGMISRGVMSGVTGRPCDLMIIDDPVKNRMEADSETYRDRVWAEWQDSFKTRLAAGAKVILIQTRWHEDDLAGRVAARERNVTVLNLPCEAEENDPLGRAEGEPLSPETGKDAEWLKSFKASETGGTRTWQALFQGRPCFTEGNILKRGWWRFYDAARTPELPRIVISVDASFKGDEDSDYVAASVWGKRGADIYLLDMIRERLDFTKTVRMLKRLAEKYPSYRAIYIEEKANGAAVISYLRRKLHGIVAVTPVGGKTARVNAVAGVIEAGNVFLPRGMVFTEELIGECAAFPRGAHDDMVDSMSQCLLREYYRNADVREERAASRRFSFEGRRRREADPLGRGEKVRVF